MISQLAKQSSQLKPADSTSARVHKLDNRIENNYERMAAGLSSGGTGIEQIQVCFVFLLCLFVCFFVFCMMSQLFIFLLVCFSVCLFVSVHFFGS